MINKIYNIFAFWAIMFFSMVAMVFVLDYAYGIGHQVIPNYPADSKYLFSACVLAPVIEEASFRYAPITLIRQTPYYEKLKWPVIIIASFIFGYLHGGILNVYIQGVAGIFFSIFYIKNNFCLTSNIVLHSLYNFTILWLLPSIR